jgi:hypothetical protein
MSIETTRRDFMKALLATGVAAAAAMPAARVFADVAQQFKLQLKFNRKSVGMIFDKNGLITSSDAEMFGVQDLGGGWYQAWMSFTKPKESPAEDGMTMHLDFSEMNDGQGLYVEEGEKVEISGTQPEDETFVFRMMFKPSKDRDERAKIWFATLSQKMHNSEFEGMKDYSPKPIF